MQKVRHPFALSFGLELASAQQVAPEVLSYHQEQDLQSLKTALANVRHMSHPAFCKSKADRSCDSIKNVETVDGYVPQVWIDFLDKMQYMLFNSSLYVLKFCKNCSSTYRFTRPKFNLYLSNEFFEIDRRDVFWDDLEISKFFIAHEIGHYIQTIAMSQGFLRYREKPDHSDVDTLGLIAMSMMGEKFPEGVLNFFEYIKNKQARLSVDTTEMTLRIQTLKESKRKLYPPEIPLN